MGSVFVSTSFWEGEELLKAGGANSWRGLSLVAMDEL